MEELKKLVYLLVLSVVSLIETLLVDPLSLVGHYVFNCFHNGDKDLRSFFCDKTVLVTGASSGIGEAMCLQLAKLSANVILTARNKDKLNDVAAKCQAIAPQNKFIVVQLDLEKYQKIDVAFCDAVFLKKLADVGLPWRGSGGIDVAILNAGMSCRGSVADTTMQSVEKLMATNFFGSAALAKGLLPHFLKRRQGTIAVVSSVQGKIGMPLRAAYAASKFAVQGFFDSLRAELLCKNINVLTVSPGYVRTALSLNAVNGDGTNYGKMDETTAKGMDPKTLSGIILKAIADGKQDIVVADAKTVLGIRLNALFPELFTQMVKLKQ